MLVCVRCRLDGGGAAAAALEIQARLLLDSSGDGERSEPWHLSGHTGPVCGDRRGPQGHREPRVLSGTASPAVLRRDARSVLTACVRSAGDS